MSAIRHADLLAQIKAPPFFEDVPARYLPFPNDRFTEGPIWCEKYWPELWQARKKFTGDDYSFFGALSKQPVRHTQNDFNLTAVIDFKGVCWELKYYLWQMFRCYDRFWNVKNGWQKLRSWPWLAILGYLSHRSSLTTISFNYDAIIEVAFAKYIHPNILYKPQDSFNLLTERKPDQMVLLKPHGSISWNPFGHIGVSGNPWIDGGPRNFVSWGSKAGRYEYPPKVCPLFPDLVPPGHSAHLLDGAADVRPAVTKAIQTCQALIVCGFSAQAPDDVEADLYFSMLQPGVPVIHIDLDRQRGKTEAETLLRKYAKTDYEFIAAEKLSELLPRLKQIC